MSVPFVVVHGAVLWKLSLIVVTGAVLGLIALVRRGRAHRAAIAKLVELDARGEAGLLRGTLGGGEVVTLTAAAHDRVGMIVDRRADALWIETADGRVTIDGAVRVVVGSRAAAARGGVPAGTPDELAQRVREVEQFGIDVARLARISAGDEVIALGRLEVVAGSRETDHRTNASARVLRPIDDAPIQLAARRPRAATPRMSVPRIAMLVAVTPLIAWWLETALGASWRRACLEVPDPGGDAAFSLSNTDACARAAAMPGSREGALERLVELADLDPYRDRASHERLIALAWSSGGCDAVLRELYEAERYDELLGAARVCGRRRAEHIALVELGRFDEAAALPVLAAPGAIGTLVALPTGPTLILAGRWTEAAAAADARATEIQDQDHAPEGHAAIDQAALSYRCLGELLRYHGGDVGAAARLRTLATGPRGGVCAPALAQAEPGAEVVELLAKSGLAEVDRARVLDQLRALATGVSEGSELTTPEAVIAQPDDQDPASRGAAIWLAATAPPLPPGAPALDHARFERWRAVAATLAGDLAAARQHAARALAAASGAEDRDQFELADVATLPAVIDLHGSGPVTYTVPRDSVLGDAIWLHEFGQLLLRSGAPLVRGTYFGPDDEYVHALETAARGDGRPLARRMGPHRGVWWRDADVMAVLPRITVGREAVVRQLVWGVPRDSVRLDHHFPWSVALHAAARRAALHVAGADADAARWAEIYQRYDQALRDRKKLIALALWDP